jgi:hypothetical protein
MKKLTSTVFAALIGLTLSMPAWSQTPSNTQTQTSKKSDDSKDSKDAKGKKGSKKKGKKDDKSTDKKTTTPDKK